MPGFQSPSQPDDTAPASASADTLSPRSRAVRAFLIAMASDQGPRLFAFQAGNLLLGRLPDNHLSINHASVSRRHARISIGARGVTIEDMGSQNGTTVNGTAIQGEHPLRPGDIVRVGHVPLYYFGFFDTENPPQPEFVDHSLVVTPSQSTVG